MFWAHSDRNGLRPESPNSGWQPLAEHLGSTGTIAAALANEARPNDASFRSGAQLAGLLHDLGKYSDCFQDMILRGRGKCPHSAFGAAIAADRRNPDVAFAIMGHHAGMPDAVNLKENLKKTIADAKLLLNRAQADAPFLAPYLEPPLAQRQQKPREFDLQTRMLFSCLVDADRHDSAGLPYVSPPLLPSQRLQQLLDRIDHIAANTKAGKVKDARNTVLQDCLQSANIPERLLSLSVPTGGGKTLAAMAFALQRATLFPDLYRRVIVVIPYLSIIEQNAEIYTNIFGKKCVLEHHSGAFERLEEKPNDQFSIRPADQDESDSFGVSRVDAAENWASPMVVTTSVRFFESLFSNRPSDLRRVHNIARSIIILDEVQTLPRRLLTPLLAIIRELSEQWGCTFVFSTATQPAFEKPHGVSELGSRDKRWPVATIREIISEPAQLQAALRRVTIRWELEQKISWSDLGARLVEEGRSVLCIVNVRDHASQLFDEVRQRVSESDAEGVFHLSTRMCAAHRLEVLDAIRRCLGTGLLCRVVSTQLVEAGVDLDFPVVYRAMGPLESVVQAAGRADRQGHLTEQLGRPGGQVIVFRPEAESFPPGDYSEAAGYASAIATNAVNIGAPIQPDSLYNLQRYWDRYYGEGADTGDKLQKHRDSWNFATLAKEFEMISDRTRDVFVPFNAEAKEGIDKLRAIGQLTRELRRTLQRYTIGLHPSEFERYRNVLEEVRKESDIWVANEAAYTLKGLTPQLSIMSYFI